jgi:subtilisin family serine protease
MSCRRGLVAAVAAMAALAAASPATAIDLSLRPASLPPLDGSPDAAAYSLAEKAQELIVAVTRGERAPAVLRRHRAKQLGEGIWLVSAREAASVVRRLDEIGALRYAHPNGRLQESARLAARGDPADPAPWWLPQIGGDRVAPPGPGFPLTIMDDGLDTAHPEFTGRDVTYLNASEVVEQEDYHGTMMSSVAAAPLNGLGVVGLYPRANLRIADTGYGNCADVLAALERAISAGPSVINMSWGFAPPSCLAMYDQIVRGVAGGVLSVAASGNLRLHFSPQSVPSIWPHVLTVGSTSRSERVSYFSNEGQGIDLAAPGEEIVSATPTWFDPSGYAELEGTSFSAAIVSAAAAWVATRRRVNVTQLSELIRSTARDVDEPGWDRNTGFGILNLPAALRRPLPITDPLEPNDDVNQVSAGRVFKHAAPALTHPGRASASVRARLDRSEDPVDVYRIYVPAGHVVRLRVVPSSNVDLEVFRPHAGSCYYKSRRRALRGALLGGSYGLGQATERFTIVNSPRNRYVYACVFKPRDELQTAAYSLRITTVAGR